LANEDLGDSLDSVEALIKKHEDFEKSLAAQEEKIKALDEFATKLIEGQHYAADDVAQRRAMVSVSIGALFEISLSIRCSDLSICSHTHILCSSLIVENVVKIL
jgi:spectrin alpha